MRKILILLCLLPVFGFGQIRYSAQKITPVKVGASLPTFSNIFADIQGQYTQLVEGDDLIDALGGVDIPYVSGTDIDQIFDFSGLVDTVYNKNAKVGNTSSLPEYYDSLWSDAAHWSDNLYYDATNPYHWKLRDFHYRYIQKQFNTLNNIFFCDLDYKEDIGSILINELAGEIYDTNTVAYGVVFEAKMTNHSGINAYFMIDGIDGYPENNGYGLQLKFDGTLALFKATSAPAFTTLYTSGAGYMTNDTDYWVRITRNSTLNEFVTGAIGTFAVYIKGGSFGTSYILASVSGGSNPVTDNDFTTASYVMFDNDPHDKVSRLSIDSVERNMYNFTKTAGEWRVDNLYLFNELLTYSKSKAGNILNSLYSRIGYNSTNKTYTYENDKVYFMGNSLTQNGVYPNTVNDSLGLMYDQKNKGVGGDNTTEMLARFQEDVIDDDHADFVVILGGTNDVLYYPESTITSNLQDMYDMAAAAGITVIALTITPRTGMASEFQTVLENVNTWILNTATNVDFKLDTYTLIEDPANPGDILPAYNSGDNVHLSTLGYQTLGTYVFQNVTW
jgi:lysophospholipase L1-like esterase